MAPPQDSTRPPTVTSTMRNGVSIVYVAELHAAVAACPRAVLHGRKGRQTA